MTPEQLMPDEVLVKRLCEWQGALLRKQAEAALNKKVPAMLANAQLRWPFPRDNQKIDEDIDTDVGNPSVYEDYAILTGAYFGATTLI